MKLLKINTLLLLLALVSACKPAFTPKPEGYYRIDLPEKSYRLFDTSGCNFAFEVPRYANLSQSKKACWYNINFEAYNATLYITYNQINQPEDLFLYTEDIRKIAYKHSIKANAIKETLIRQKENDKIGVIYDIKGNAASNVNFYITDSTQHFLSGALYFNSKPNYDSISPVLQFFRKDIVHLIETLTWK